MRNRKHRLGACAAVLALLAASASCATSDDTDSGTSAPTPDAAQPDATSSTGNDASQIDSGSGDATVDSAAADAMVDAAIDSGTVDSARIDSATIDSGSVADASDSGANEAASDSSAGDAGGDAAGDAGPSGPILYYTFDDGTGTVVTDSSGNGHNGTLETTTDAGVSTIWTTMGRTMGAISLSGAQDVAFPSGVLTGVQNMTAATWIELTTITPFSRIFDLGNGLPGLGGTRWTFLTPQGISGVQWNMYGGVGDDGAINEAVVSPSTQLPTGVWKHVAVTASGSNYAMYIDGFPVAELTDGPVVLPSDMEPLAPTSWIGKSRFNDPGLSGLVDEMRIYDRVLAPSEIANLAWPQTDYSDWRFDDGTGLTAVDSSDNANNGTLTNGVTWSSTGRLGGSVELPGGLPPADAAGGPTIVLGSAPLKNCTTELTVSAWVEVHAQANWARIFNFGSGTVAFTYLAATDGAGMHFAMVSPNGVLDAVSPIPVPSNGGWHHVAVTVTSAGSAADASAAETVTLYIDGGVVLTQTTLTNVMPGDFSATTDNWFGRSTFPTDPYLNAGLDEMRISCRAYTADEIKNLAHQ